MGFTREVPRVVVQESRTELTSRTLPDRARTRSVDRAKIERRAGWLFSLPYAALLGGFGVFPALYALYLSFVKPSGGFTLADNFRTVFEDFRFLPALRHVALFMALYMIPSLIISIVIALLIEQRRPRVATGLQVLYYIPHALIGPAGVIVWLFMLTPSVSPIGPLLRAMDLHDLIEVTSTTNLAGLLTIITLWSGGNTILLMYAALTGVPRDVLEAARIDGCNAWRLAVSIKLPLMRKWIAYVLILHIGAASQMFAEPQLIANTTHGAIGENWSPLQLGYTFAYQYGNFGAAAALSFVLLSFALLCAVAIIRVSSLFRIEI